jgi:hypothetical protein
MGQWHALFKQTSKNGPGFRTEQLAKLVVSGEAGGQFRVK